MLGLTQKEKDDERGFSRADKRTPQLQGVNISV